MKRILLLLAVLLSPLPGQQDPVQRYILRLTGDPLPKPNNTLKALCHLPLRVTAGEA